MDILLLHPLVCFVDCYYRCRAPMDISLELKGLPCLNKVYLLTYLLTYSGILRHGSTLRNMPKIYKEL